MPRPSSLAALSSSRAAAAVPAPVPAPAGGDPAAARAAVLARVRLRHLQCFLAVARAGNLRRAAALLSVSQPAVTKTLAELEALLGVRLFERDRRGTVPTPAAEAFRPHAEASLAALGDAVDALRESAPAPAPLVLGVLPTVTGDLLPGALARWREGQPQRALRVSTGLNHELLAALRAGELDLVLGRMAEPADMRGLSFELLVTEPLVVVGRAGHPLRRARPPSAARLSACPWVLPLPGTVIRHAADGWMERAGVTPTAGLTETLSGELARALLAGSDTLWCAPAAAVAPGIAAGELAPLTLDLSGTEEPLGLLRAADRHRSVPPGLAALVQALHAEAAARRVPARGRRR